MSQRSVIPPSRDFLSSFLVNDCVNILARGDGGDCVLFFRSLLVLYAVDFGWEFDRRESRAVVREDSKGCVGR